MLARWCLSILGLVVLVSPLSLAQENRRFAGDIRVRVSLENGRSAGDRLRVELLTTRGIYVKETYSDDSGNAVFRDVPDGSYRLRLSGIQILDLTTEEFTVDNGRAILQMVTVQLRPNTDQTGAPLPMVAAVDLNIPEGAKKEFGRGVDALQKNDWPEARRYFQKATELYPQYASAYNNLGVALMNLGQRNQGKQAFERAVSLNDHFANAYLNLGRVAVAEGKYPEAEAFLNKAVGLNPLNPAGLLLLSHVEAQLGKYDECIAIARRLHNVPHEGYALAHLFAARALEAKHDSSEAIAEYKIFLKEAPNSPSASKASAALKALQSQIPH